MERLKKKELEQLRLEKEHKASQQKTALRSLIKGQQSIEIVLNFTEQFLKNNAIENLAEYSPTHISRLIFDSQLQKIKKQIEKLPSHEANIEHFIIIMMKVMQFPFEKSPYYMVGLKDMFHEIVQDNQTAINYDRLFKYILGQLVTMKQEEQNTQFQVQLKERKKQDYLLHDNGIKRIYYSKDMKLMLTLDERANAIKIYDNQMKNINKFAPKKQKHGNKFPIILDFDYSQITTRLGVVLSDCTISTINLPDFLNKTSAQFQASALNQLVFPLPEKMRMVHFLQMMNKWVTVTEQNNKVYLFDMERVRSQPQKVMTRKRIQNGDLRINLILEVVPLSCICVVAGNQVSFYNQNFAQTKFTKFSHCQQITHFKYSDEKNLFYLCGKQKYITSFSITRNGSPSKILTFNINKLITDFQIFPFFDTIVIADESNDIRLIHQTSKTVYQQVSYNHIVKAKDKTISIFKMSKNQLAIYQTYLIVMAQQKIAIERDTEYSFSPFFYIDHKKEELFISVNNQIISFSLTSGEIRKNYSMDSSNIQKHNCFFIAQKTPLFILDHEFNLYEIYQKQIEKEGQNRGYRKQINIEEALNCFYDEEMRNLMVIGKNNLNQIRNDHNNNFNVINGLNFVGFNTIIKSSFCPHSKTISILTSDQLIYQFKNYNINIDSCTKFVFPGDSHSHEQRLITDFNYDAHYELFVLFTNTNQVYLINKVTGQQIYFNIQQNLPSKLKHLKFVHLKYQLVQEKKGYFEPYLLLTDDTGFILQFSLAKILEEFNFTIYLEEHSVKNMFKQTHTISNEGIQIQHKILVKQNRVKRTYQEIGLMKAHEKRISIAIKTKLQILTTLTIAIDGYIRLWNNKYDCLFSLKIPSLIKMVWNMKEIDDIKNKKSIEELLLLYKQHFREAMDEHHSPSQIYNKSKRLKQKPQPAKINMNDPIKIQIQNKDIEDVVNYKPDYFSTFYETKSKNKTQQLYHTQKVYPHPWRMQKQFVKIFERASPPHKYKQKIPEDLLQMRNSLDMTEKIKQVPNFKQAQLILPQLAMYQSENQFVEKKKIEPAANEEQGEAFESCLYVKSIKKKKKINQFDQIDKEFKKKQMALTARKWVPKKRKERNSSVSELKSQSIGAIAQSKVDPIRAIQNIFQQHNRECLQQKKGRMIRIPKINLNRDFY